MNTILKIATASLFLFGGTAASAQEPTLALDGPMHQVFSAPGVALRAYRTRGLRLKKGLRLKGECARLPAAIVRV